MKLTCPALKKANMRLSDMGAHGTARHSVRHNGDETTIALLTTEEATAWVRSAPRGARFFVHVNMDAFQPGSDAVGDVAFRDGIKAPLRITGRAMLSLLKDGLSQTLQDLGGRWRCTVTVHGYGSNKAIYYWVG